MTTARENIKLFIRDVTRRLNAYVLAFEYLTINLNSIRLFY